MIKKQLANGNFCRKCTNVEELLKKRGYRDRIDEVLVAVEDDPESPGMKLAAEYGVSVAPFFIVQQHGAGGRADSSGRGRVYTSALKLIRDVFSNSPAGAADVAETAARLQGESPEEIAAYALKLFGRDCGIAFSGAEDVVLIHMAVESGFPFSVFCLDTGRLHPETYRFIEKVRNTYGVEITMLSPDHARLELFVKKKGLFSFYTDGHGQCCGIRKVEPLKRALGGFRAWMTGQRKDQNPATRGEVPHVQEDPSFSGAGGGRLLKFNPLSDWTLTQVWDYIRANGIPCNELHDRGFISIGCAPCSRAVQPGEHERAGRWWWEEETKRECGLHTGGG